MYAYNDGGRAAAGFRGSADDCVTRAIAIALQMDYATVYREMAEINASMRATKKTRGAGRRTARDGIYTKRKPFKDYMSARGWRFIPTMGIGTGCKVHLRSEELPKGRIIANVSKHLVAVIDGIIHDTHDCTRNGTRCVYGYWVQE